MEYIDSRFMALPMSSVKGANGKISLGSFEVVQPSTNFYCPAIVQSKGETANIRNY